MIKDFLEMMSDTRSSFNWYILFWYIIGIINGIIIGKVF